MSTRAQIALSVGVLAVMAIRAQPAEQVKPSPAKRITLSGRAVLLAPEQQFAERAGKWDHVLIGGIIDTLTERRVVLDWEAKTEVVSDRFKVVLARPFVEAERRRLDSAKETGNDAGVHLLSKWLADSLEKGMDRGELRKLLGRTDLSESCYQFWQCCLCDSVEIASRGGSTGVTVRLSFVWEEKGYTSFGGPGGGFSSNMVAPQAELDVKEGDKVIVTRKFTPRWPTNGHNLDDAYRSVEADLFSQMRLLTPPQTVRPAPINTSDPFPLLHGGPTGRNLVLIYNDGKRPLRYALEGSTDSGPVTYWDDVNPGYNGYKQVVDGSYRLFVESGGAVIRSGTTRIDSRPVEFHVVANEPKKP